MARVGRVTAKRQTRDQALISRIMASVQSRNTGPELSLRKALRTLGRPFWYQPTNIPGRPDFVFPKDRVVLFVDGDFWHGRQWKLRGLKSLAEQFSRSNNRAYWTQKISRNVERDAKTTRLLRRLGWCVIRVWETNVKSHPERCLRRIQRALSRTS